MGVYETIYEKLLEFLQEQIDDLIDENDRLQSILKNGRTKYIELMTKKVTLGHEIEELATQKESLPSLEEELKQQKKEYIKGSIHVFILLSFISLIFPVLGAEFSSFKAFLTFGVQAIVSLGIFMAGTGASLYLLNTNHLRNKIKEINFNSLSQKIASKANAKMETKNTIILYRNQNKKVMQRIKNNEEMIKDYQRRKDYLEEMKNNGKMQEVLDQLFKELPPSVTEPLENLPVQSSFPVTEFMSSASVDSGFMLRRKAKKEFKQII